MQCLLHCICDWTLIWEQPEVQVLYARRQSEHLGGFRACRCVGVEVARNAAARNRRMEVVFMANGKVSSELRWCGCSAVVVIEVCERRVLPEVSEAGRASQTAESPYIPYHRISQGEQHHCDTAQGKPVHGHRSICSRTTAKRVGLVARSKWEREQTTLEHICTTSIDCM
jgi:hypothetical protein